MIINQWSTQSMKRSKHFITLQILSLIASTQTFAATLPKSCDNSHQISVGLEGFYYNYREPNLMRSRGFLYGLNAAYNIPFCSDFFFQPDLRFSYGETNYTSHGTGSLKHIPNWLFETRLIMGKRFCLANNSHIDPYVGLGYRFKSDDTDGMRSTTGHWGYYRRSQYLYIPVGVTFHQNLSYGWSLSPTIEFDVFLLGRQQSHTRNAHHFKQSKGYGLRGDLMMNKQFSHGTISFGPFINYWDIKNSNVVKDKFGNGWIEPDNKTLETGLKVKYVF
jgi:hypothetical protein